MKAGTSKKGKNESIQIPKQNSGAMVIAFAGNPNCGKTTAFNFITGSTATTGNRPGVTVDGRGKERLVYDIIEWMNTDA